MASVFLHFQPPEVAFDFQAQSAQETQHKSQTVNLTFPWSPIRTINQAQICFELGRACPRKFRNFNDPLGQSQAHLRAFTKKTSNWMDFMWFLLCAFGTALAKPDKDPIRVKIKINWALGWCHRTTSKQTNKLMASRRFIWFHFARTLSAQLDCSPFLCNDVNQEPSHTWAVMVIRLR